MVLLDKIQGFKEKGKKAVLAGLVTLPFFGSGCELTQEDKEILGLAALIGAPYADDARAGAALAGSGNALSRSAAAEAGKSEINVYNGSGGGNGQNLTRKTKRKGLSPKSYKNNQFFSSNNYRGDLNNNGAYDIEEFENVGRRKFLSSENIIFGYHLYGEKASNLEISLKNSKNKITDTLSIFIDSNGCSGTVELEPEDKVIGENKIIFKPEFSEEKEITFYIISDTYN